MKNRLIIALILGIILLCVFDITRITRLPDTRLIGDYHGDWLSKAREIGLAMFDYAKDHGEKYPDGKSSTEIFQAFLDQKYITDPATFYIGMPGKIPAKPEERLRPENVCYDVTAGAEISDSDDLPIIYMTGFRVTFVAGSAAIPLMKPYPAFGNPRTWPEWFAVQPKFEQFNDPGIAVLYNDSRVGIVRMTMSGPDIGTLPHFVPLKFNPKGKVYRQLTPEGSPP